MTFTLVTSIPSHSGTSSSGPQGQNVTGPLGDLNASGFNYNLYAYPSSPNNQYVGKGHQIIFYINIPKESFWNTTGSTGTRGPAPVANRISDASNFALRPDTGPAGSNSNSWNMGQNATTGAVNYVLQSQTRRTTDAISLYIPNTMVFDHHLKYESVSLTDAFGIVGDAAYAALSSGRGNGRAALSAITSLLPDLARDTEVGHALGQLGSSARESLNQGLGIADNPQNFLLFKQIDFRKFGFDFILTPESAAEADIINQIIYLFRFHSVPEVLSGSTGRFFVPPSQFDFDVMHNGNLNQKIPQINTCVLTSVNVDYGAAGHWVTYTDGQPVQITLSLRFTEIAILTKDLIQNSF